MQYCAIAWGIFLVSPRNVVENSGLTVSPIIFPRSVTRGYRPIMAQEPAPNTDAPEDTLFKRLHPGVEAEANYGAGYLIFQGDRFHREALKDQISMRTPLALCSQYGASRHATLHYYVEHHPYAVALLIAGRYPYADGSIPVWNSIESPEFERRFGHLQDRLPEGKLRIAEGDNAPLADILLASHSSIDPPSQIIHIPDSDGTGRRFVAEAFFNQWTHFVLVAEEKSTRLGRRVRLAS
jgi:hypothetical protein